MSLRVLLPTLLVIMVSTPSVAEDAAWTPLCDGSTLDGWSSQVKGDVKAENGEIRILSMKNLWLVHESKFDDFELVVEAKMPNDNRFAGGCVALQHHGKGGLHRFRNVRIRSLERASARAATDEPANATPSSSAFTIVSKILHDEARELIGANRVQISGCYAFVGGSLSPKGRVEAGGDSASPNMTVVDISDPSGPKVVANLPFADLRGPNGLTIVGKVAFYAGGQTICAVDISDPLTPVTLASQSFPRFKEDAEKTDNYHDLVYRDGYLFVSAQTDNGFLILRVNDKRIRQLADEANE